MKYFIESEENTVLITISAIQGSAPRSEGTFMLVNNTASFGTIGGGILEYDATKKARNTDFFNEGLTPLQKASNVKFESEKGSRQSLKTLDPSANPFVPNLFIPKSPQEPVPPRSSSKRFQTSKKSNDR